jgi:enterochelin esterase-like enzyme
MKKYYFIALLFLAACEKEASREVTYRVTDSVSGFSLRYLDENGQLQSEQVNTQSAQDIWQYSYLGEDGDIVFVSTNYKDPSSSIKVQILVDGKLYRQSSSRNDTVSFVTVSGVIPIRE